MLPLLQVQVQIAIAAALSFAAAGIGDTRFSDSAEPRDHRATLGIAAEIVLDQAQNLIGAVPGKLVELPRESSGLDEYHNVIVSQYGITAKPRRAGLAKGGSIHFGRI
jgi:hypothetical protein